MPKPPDRGPSPGLGWAHGLGAGAMTVRDATLADADDLSLGWEESLPIIRSRWPASAGGAGAVPSFSAQAIRGMFSDPNIHIIAYDEPGLVNAGWMRVWIDETARANPRRDHPVLVRVDLLAIRKLPGESTDVQRLRLRALLIAALTKMAQDMIASGHDYQIVATFPDVQDTVTPPTIIQRLRSLVGLGTATDTDSMTTVRRFLDQMTAANNILPINRDDFLLYYVTPELVLTGLATMTVDG